MKVQILCPYLESVHGCHIETRSLYISLIISKQTRKKYVSADKTILPVSTNEFHESYTSGGMKRER